jgi:predicted metal-binding membrane protein
MHGMHMNGGAAPSSEAASFLGMWAAMMVAMMLPSVAPTLWRYRRVLTRTDTAGARWLPFVAAAGYFAVWTAIGLVVYPLGLALETAGTELPALARALPVATGLVVLIAGAVQLTAWKARQLARCREVAEPGRAVPTDVGAVAGHGLRLGWHCSLSCAGPMASLLAIGMMDLRAMAVVTAAVTLERVLPARQRVARVIGIGGVAIGAFIVARALTSLTS